MPEPGEYPTVPIRSTGRRRRRASEHVRWRGVGHQAGQSVGKIAGISARVEQFMDSSDGHGREERLEVESDQHVRPDMRVDRSERRAAPDETVRSVMSRYPFEYLPQHGSLEVGQDRLGRLDQPERPRTATMPAVPVVPHRLDGCGPLERARIDVTHQLGRVHPDQIGEIARRVEVRDPEPHRGTHRRASQGRQSACATRRHDCARRACSLVRGIGPPLHAV